MAKQGIDILLQTIIFTCVKQMEKYRDRVNWLVLTEKDLLCVCLEARHISIPPAAESGRDLHPVAIMCFCAERRPSRRLALRSCAQLQDPKPPQGLLSSALSLCMEHLWYS